MKAQPVTTGEVLVERRSDRQAYARMNYLDLYDGYLDTPLSRNQAEHERSLEELADRLSRPLSQALAVVHGAVLDFDCLTRPLAYLVIYQVTQGRRQRAGAQAEIRAFSSYKDLAGVCPGDATHRLMLSLLETEIPEQLAGEFLAQCPGNPAVDTPTPIESRPSTTRLGIGFGMSFTERVQLTLRLPGRLKFVRGRDIASADLSGSMRLRVLQALAPSFTEDPAIKAIQVYLVLVMPVFMLESFSTHYIAASKVAVKLRGLVVGTEFQRKPLVSMLIALVKSAGKPVVGIQHGGGYGQTDPNWWERAERWFCDSYRTWGYRYSGKDQPLASIKLSRQANKAKRRQKSSYAGLELRILLAIPYISEELESSLYSPPYALQVTAIESSLSILGPLLERDCQLTIRLHPKNKGAAFIQNLSVAGDPRVSFSTGVRGSIAEDASDYSALVFSSPQATCIAECLAAGRPFYVAASPEFFWIRDEAADHYREMQRSGIWLTRFDQVEALIQSGFDNMTHRQHVFRHNFANTFACHSDGYLAEWVEMLKHV